MCDIDIVAHAPMFAVTRRPDLFANTVKVALYTHEPSQKFTGFSIRLFGAGKALSNPRRFGVIV